MEAECWVIPSVISNLKSILNSWKSHRTWNWIFSCFSYVSLISIGSWELTKRKNVKSIRKNLSNFVSCWCRSNWWHPSKLQNFHISNPQPSNNFVIFTILNGDHQHQPTSRIEHRWWISRSSDTCALIKTRTEFTLPFTWWILSESRSYFVSITTIIYQNEKISSFNYTHLTENDTSLGRHVSMTLHSQKLQSDLFVLPTHQCSKLSKSPLKLLSCMLCEH